MTNSNTIHLQGIGLVNAVTAAELTIGTRTIWNYGYVAVVQAIKPKGKQSIEVTLITEGSGHVGNRVFRKTRLVGIVRNKSTTAT